MLSALRIRGVRPVLGLYALDATLEFGLAVVLMVLVYDATQSPALVAVMLTCKQIAPGVITAISGLGLDRMSPRRGLLMASALRLVGLLVLALSPFGVLTFVGAALLGFGGSVVRTVLRALLAVAAGAELRHASAALNVIFGVVLVYGPLLGAVLAASLSISVAVLVWVPVALIAGVGGFVLTSASDGMGISSYALQESESHAVSEVSTVGAPAGGESAELASRREARAAWRLFVVASATMFFVAMDEPALLAFVEQSLGGDVGDYGWLLAAWGGGLLLGGALYGRLVRLPTAPLFGVSALVVALGYLGLAASQSVAMAMVIAVFGGVGNGVLSATMLVAMLESQPAASTVRSSALLEFIGGAAPAAGMIAGGLLAEFVAIRATLAVPGAATLLIVGGWLLLERQHGRRRPAPRAVPAATSPAPDAMEVAL